ncbi:Conserved_hypothetical protein [Hexamita inflata]|uniref:EF-hand domain-containing protein n=1 Tax=Hexamita inflata TaxID=28002 RepID=A0AA86TYQ2_9EUKA|nr:Conserved hypothetical protein [Hexamita inflata]
MPAITTIIENVLKTTVRAKHVVYRQGDAYIAKAMQVGVPTDAICQNLPSSFDAQEVEQQLVRNPLNINGENLYYANSDDNLILLENYKNEQCTTGALVVMKQHSAYLFIGFFKTQTRLDYEKLLFSTVKSLEKLNIFTDFELFIKPPQKQQIKPFNFESASEITFKSQKYSLIQSTKPYAMQKFGLFLVLSASSPYFEFNIQKAARSPNNVHTVIAIASADKNSYKQMTKKSYFVSQVNIADISQAKLLDSEDLQYFLIDFSPKIIEQKDTKKEKTDAPKIPDPIIISQGGSFEQLNAFLSNQNEEFDTSVTHFGDLDMSFFGIKLKFFKQIRIEQDDEFVCVFSNPKSATFQTEMNQLLELKEAGLKVIVVLQNSWEGNVAQILKKVTVDTDFGLLYDTNNVFGSVKQITNNQLETQVFYFLSQKLKMFNCTIPQVIKAVVTRQKTEDASNKLNQSEATKRMNASSRLLLNDAKPVERLNSTETLQKLFMLYAKQDQLQIQDLIRIAKQENAPVDNLQEVFNEFSTSSAMNFSNFLKFVEKMNWQIRDRFYAHEDVLINLFQKIEVEKYADIKSCTQVVRQAAMNEIIAEAAFKQQQTVENKINYEQFKFVLLKLGWKPAMMQNGDINGQEELKQMYNSQMDLEGFVKVCAKLGYNQLLAETAFKTVDNGNGKLSLEEFQEGIYKLGWRLKKLTVEDL